jgi:MFS family permease
MGRRLRTHLLQLLLPTTRPGQRFLNPGMVRQQHCPTQQYPSTFCNLRYNLLHLGVSLYRCAIKSFGFIDTFHYIDYLTILASLWGAVSLSFHAQLFSRLLLGLVVGLNSIIIPTYLTSCLPGSMDGPAGTLNQLFITIGIFSGYLFGIPLLDCLPEDASWRLVLALPCLPALIRLYTSSNIFP